MRFQFKALQNSVSIVVLRDRIFPCTFECTADTGNVNYYFDLLIILILTLFIILI